MLLDYDMFLDNPEGHDLQFDAMTVIWWIVGPLVYNGLEVLLRSLGVDFAWFFAICYVVYYNYLVK